VITANGGTPQLVNDGVTITPEGFASNWSAEGPAWIAFAFKQPRRVSRAEINFNTLDQRYINTPETMEIQSSPDGSQWTTITTVRPPATGSGAWFGFPTVFHFLPTVARYMRLAFPPGGTVDLLEVRFAEDLVNNLAISARITASSIFDPRYACENVADGVIGEHGNGEWSSKGEAAPWIRLTWNKKVSVGRITLYDRPHPTDNIQQGRLVFSDGSSIEVTGIPDDSSPKTITFPTKTVDWVEFRASGDKPGNKGLSELEIYEQ
jgi:hypothetical protein